MYPALAAGISVLWWQLVSREPKKETSDPRNPSVITKKSTFRPSNPVWDRSDAGELKAPREDREKVPFFFNRPSEQKVPRGGQLLGKKEIPELPCQIISTETQKSKVR